MDTVIFPSKCSDAYVNLIFDFTSKMAAAETISTQAVTASVYTGVDASPSAIVSGSASASGKQVTQKIIDGEVGTIYALTCTITTSASQKLMLTGLLAIVPPTV